MCLQITYYSGKQARNAGSASMSETWVASSLCPSKLAVINSRLHICGWFVNVSRIYKAGFLMGKAEEPNTKIERKWRSSSKTYSQFDLFGIFSDVWRVFLYKQDNFQTKTFYDAHQKLKDKFHSHTHAWCPLPAILYEGLSWDLQLRTVEFWQDIVACFWYPNCDLMFLETANLDDKYSASSLIRVSTLCFASEKISAIEEINNLE